MKLIVNAANVMTYHGIMTWQFGKWNEPLNRGANLVPRRPCEMQQDWFTQGTQLDLAGVVLSWALFLDIHKVI